MDEYIGQLLAELAAQPPQFAHHKEFANNLRDFLAVVPQGHGLEGDPLAFLSAVSPNSMTWINGELARKCGLKASLVPVITIELKSWCWAQSNVRLPTPSLQWPTSRTHTANPQCCRDLESCTGGQGQRNCSTGPWYRKISTKSYFPSPNYLPWTGC